MSNSKPVLVIGGSGVVGSLMARTLRRLHPELPIAIGGRDLAKAEAIAASLGNAVATTIDLDRPDLGLAEGESYAAVAIFVKDDTLNALRYALDKGIPHIGISSGTFEIGPEVALFVHHPNRAPVVMASQWLAGAAVFPVLHFATAYQSLETINIGAVFDELDMGGPAASADFERITTVAPAALTIEDGSALWVTGEDAKGRLRSVDGTEMETQAYSPFDVISLGAATNARSIRFELAYGVSSSRRRGEPFSTEIIIELAGKKGGAFGRSRYEIVHPAGQAPLSALGVALAMERLLGLDGRAAPSNGLYLPETLLDPAYFVRRMKEFGAHFEASEPTELVV